MTISEYPLLEVEHILAAHEEMIELYGGAPGILNMGLVESVVGSVEMATFYNPEMSLFQIAAKYGYKLIKNHCFEDGNKRVGAHVAFVYLDVNGITLEYDEVEARDIYLAVATSEMSEDALCAWLESKSI